MAALIRDQSPETAVFPDLGLSGDIAEKSTQEAIALALYDFYGKGNDELSFKKEDIF